jgi:hypothetical protein
MLLLEKVAQKQRLNNKNIYFVQLFLKVEKVEKVEK